MVTACRPTGRRAPRSLPSGSRGTRSSRALRCRGLRAPRPRLTRSPADGLDDRPAGDRHDEDEGTHRDHTDHLRQQLLEPASEEEPLLGDGGRGADGGIREQAERQGAEDAVHHVNRERTHRIVDAHAVEEQHRLHHENSGDDADHEGAPHADEGARRGDRHEPSETAVEGHAEIRLTEQPPGGEQRADRRRRRRGVRRGGDVSDRGPVGGHGRARIEPEPAEPQDEHPDRRRRHAVTRNGDRLSVLVYFPMRGPSMRMPANAAQPPIE